LLPNVVPPNSDPPEADVAWGVPNRPVEEGAEEAVPNILIVCPELLDALPRRLGVDVSWPKRGFETLSQGHAYYQLDGLTFATVNTPGKDHQSWSKQVMSSEVEKVSGSL
jgi:hypothetical protein